MIQPTVGRIVHYVLRPGVLRAAIVVNVESHERLELHVFYSRTDPEFGGAPLQGVREDPVGRIVGSWHWPLRAAEDTDRESSASSGSSGR